MSARALFAAGSTLALAPCPFCAGAVAMEEHHGIDRGVRIGCDNADCPVQPDVTARTQEQATAAWNTRPDTTRVVELANLDACAAEAARRASYGSVESEQAFAQAFVAGATGGARPMASSDPAQSGFEAGRRHARRAR